MEKQSTYKIECIRNSEGTKLTRINDGFSSLELLGILELSKNEVIKQITGEIKPDVINRIAIIDNENKLKKY